MHDKGAAGGNLGPMKETAVGEEDAERIRAFDDEAAVPAGLCPRVAEDKKAPFGKPQITAIGREASHSAQASNLVGLEVPDATHQPPITGEE